MRAEIKPKVGYIAFASNIAKSLDFDTAVKIPTGVCCHSYARLLVYRNVRAIYAKVEDSNRCESIVERLRELIENCIDGMGYLILCCVTNQPFDVCDVRFSWSLVTISILPWRKTRSILIADAVIAEPNLKFWRQRYGFDRWIAVPLFRNIPGVVYCPVNFQAS